MKRAYFEEVKGKIKDKSLQIGIVGLGYVGLPLAVDFARKRFFVTGVDVDKERVAKIRSQETYITDISNSDLKKVILMRRLRAEHDFSALRQADVVIICVPTPLKRKYHPDISFIKGAVRGITKNMKKNALIILESTTYPGTTEEVILPMLESGKLKHGRDFYLCFSPERIDPGNPKYTLSKIPKLIGGITPEATALGVLVYSSIIHDVVPVSSTRVAETAKLLENTFRIVNIGLIDEIAMMARKMNINIWEVIEAAKTKPFGFMPFYPGPGVGGHCIPKDPLYLYWKAKKFGFKSRFIKLASEIINHMPVYVVDCIREIFIQRGLRLDGAKILVIGVTYKKDVKDLRKSPGLDIIEILEKNHALVSYHDPLIPYLKLNHINLKSVEIDSKNLSSFDCAVIVADHTSVDYSLILRKSRLIFDTRNVYKGLKNERVFSL